MVKIEFYEKSLCCSNGGYATIVDGPGLKIKQIFGLLNEQEGVEAIRFGLSKDVKPFLLNKEVLYILEHSGEESLPITLVDGKVIQLGEYLSLEALTELTGVMFKEVDHVLEASCQNNQDCCSS